jgi:predicted nucleotidyltransferase
VYNQFMPRKRSLESLLKGLRRQLPSLAERYGVETLVVFGSYVRDEQKADSDLDVLVTFHEEPSLLTFIAIENHLSDALGVKVDLVMKDSLKPAIGQVILDEAMSIIV